MVGFQLHGVDKSTWYRLPPACADKDHFYGLQHLVRPRLSALHRSLVAKTHGLGCCVQDELTAAFEYCALAAEVVTAQPTPFGALARL